MARKEAILTTEAVTATFSDPVWAAKYPPMLNVDQAAELLQVPKQTVYDWRSRGLLKGCSRKIGKHVRFFRNKLILLAFNEGLRGNEK